MNVAVDARKGRIGHANWSRRCGEYGCMWRVLRRRRALSGSKIVGVRRCGHAPEGQVENPNTATGMKHWKTERVRKNWLRKSQRHSGCRENRYSIHVFFIVQGSFRVTDNLRYLHSGQSHAS